MGNFFLDVWVRCTYLVFHCHTKEKVTDEISSCAKRFNSVGGFKDVYIKYILFIRLLYSFTYLFIYPL